MYEGLNHTYESHAYHLQKAEAQITVPKRKNTKADPDILMRNTFWKLLSWGKAMCLSLCLHIHKILVLSPLSYPQLPTAVNQDIAIAKFCHKGSQWLSEFPKPVQERDFINPA